MHRRNRSAVSGVVFVAVGTADQLNCAISERRQQWVSCVGESRVDEDIAEEEGVDLHPERLRAKARQTNPRGFVADILQPGPYILKAPPEPAPPLLPHLGILYRAAPIDANP